MITALEQVNPLAKYGAVLPIFLVVILSKSLAMLVGVGLASLLLLFLLSRQPFRIWAAVLTAVPGLAVLFMFTLAVWIPAPPGETPLFALGSVAWHSTSLEISAATGARISAILALALMVGLTTDTRGLVRAAVQNLRLPYRVGYAALIAFEFVPHLQTELTTIRLAHRARYAAVPLMRRLEPRRIFGFFTIPIALLAGGIRHAERVSIAMETRSFGLHNSRTERHSEPFRSSDWLWLIGLVALFTIIIVSLTLTA